MWLGFLSRNYWSLLDYDRMASIWEKAISILAGNLNSGRSYLITAVWKSWKRSSLRLSQKSRISFHCSNTIKNCKTTGYHKRLSGQVWKEKKRKIFESDFCNSISSWQVSGVAQTNRMLFFALVLVCLLFSRKHLIRIWSKLFHKKV